jgi:hypothetical protein
VCHRGQERLACLPSATAEQPDKYEHAQEAKTQEPVPKVSPGRFG